MVLSRAQPGGSSPRVSKGCSVKVSVYAEGCTIEAALAHARATVTVREFKMLPCFLHQPQRGRQMVARRETSGTSYEIIRVLKGREESARPFRTRFIFDLFQRLRPKTVWPLATILLRLQRKEIFTF